MVSVLLQVLPLLLASPVVQSATRPAQESPGLDTLIERIARDDLAGAEAATEALLRRLADPLAEALAAVEQRPLEEQIRLEYALARVTATLRMRVFRARLGAEDRAAFDRFAERYEALARRLFADDPEERRSALEQLPLEPGTGAGVFVAAKVLDPDATVCAAALELAEQWQDDAVVRGLLRFLRIANAVGTSEGLGANRDLIRIVYADASKRAITGLAAAGAREALPVILETLEVYGRSKHRDVFEPAIALGAIGRLGDPSATTALLGWMEDPTLHRVRGLARGAVTQTVGDRALLSLLEIHGLDPEDYGFSSTDGFLGFSSDDARHAARSRFRLWFEQNGMRDPASQPADTP